MSKQESKFEHDEDFGAGWDSDDETVETPDKDSVDTEEVESEEKSIDDELLESLEEDDEDDSDDSEEEVEDDDNDLEEALRNEEEESYKKRFADTRAWAEKQKKEFEKEKQELFAKLDDATKQLSELKKTHTSKEISEMDFDDMFDEDVSELIDTYPGLKKAMIGIAQKISQKTSKESFSELYSETARKAEEERNKMKVIEEQYWNEITDEEYGHPDGRETLKTNLFQKWWDLPINDRLAEQVKKNPTNATLVVHAIDRFKEWKAKQTANRIDAKNKVNTDAKIKSAAGQVKTKKSSSKRSKPTNGTFEDGWNSI